MDVVHALEHQRGTLHLQKSCKVVYVQDKARESQEETTGVLKVFLDNVILWFEHTPDWERLKTHVLYSLFQYHKAPPCSCVFSFVHPGGSAGHRAASCPSSTKNKHSSSSAPMRFRLPSSVTCRNFTSRAELPSSVAPCISLVPPPQAPGRRAPWWVHLTPEWAAL